MKAIGAAIISMSGALGPDVESSIVVGFDKAFSNLTFGSSVRTNAAISATYETRL
jgi:hypothetical protein